jgi:hypothetical protein
LFVDVGLDDQSHCSGEYGVGFERRGSHIKLVGFSEIREHMPYHAPSSSKEDSEDCGDGVVPQLPRN